MANEDKKEELLITQELLEWTRAHRIELDKKSETTARDKVELRDQLNLARELSDVAHEEALFEKQTTESLRSRTELLAAQAKQENISSKLKEEHASISAKLASDEFFINKSKLKEELKALDKQITGSGTIEKSIQKQLKSRIKLNKKLGLGKKLLEGMNKIPLVGQFIDAEKALSVMEKTTIKTGSGLRGLVAGLGSGMASLAASGPLILFTAVFKILKFMVDMAFALSEQMVKVQTTTGISKEHAEGMYYSFREIAKDSGKVYLTSKKITKTFTELTEKTGLIAQFGGDFLETMSTLQDRLGMSVDESEQLSYLTRLQGKDGDKILETQVKIVNQYSKQNQLSVTAKGIFKDIAQTSQTVVVALGQSIGQLTNATLAARKLGLSMDEIHQAGAGFLDFQSSIQKELEFSLLTNKQIDFSKERQLALDNKLGELGEALFNKEELLLAFRTGNAIVMKTAAAAMNLQSDQLARIIRQQEYNNLAAEEYVEIYGEASYASLLALSQQETMNAALDKMKDKMMEIGQQMLPIIERFTTWLVQITESGTAFDGLIKLMKTMVIVAGAFAARSITMAIATAWSTAMAPNPQNIASSGLWGLGIGALLTTGILAATSMPPSLPPVEVADATVKIKALDEDQIEIDKSTGRVSIGTNRQTIDSEGIIKSLKEIKTEIVKNRIMYVTTSYDDFAAYDPKAGSGVKKANTKHKSSFP